MKYFVQVKFREFQWHLKVKNLIVIIFQILQFGPQNFQNFQFDPKKL